MSVKVNMEALATPYLLRVVEDDIERINEEIEKAWNSKKRSLELKGFRRGQVPRSVAERTIGVNQLYDRFINQLFDEGTSNLSNKIVGIRTLDIVQFEKDKHVVLEAIVDIQPVVELGEYKGIEVQELPLDVSDKEVEETLKNLQEANAIVTPRKPGDKAQMGDIVLIDFKGVLAKTKKEFAGSSSENYELTLGSKTFVDNFEEQLVGADTGESVKVTVTFPNDFPKETAGRKVLFDVKVKEIKEKQLPDLDDEFAKDCGFETLQDARQCLKDDVLQNKKDRVKSQYENALIDEAIKLSKIKEIPESMVMQRLDVILKQQAQNHKSVDDFLKAVKLTREQFNVYYQPRAMNEIKIRLLLEKIAEAEKLEVTDSEVEDYYIEESQRSNMGIDDLKNRLGITIVRDNVKIRKAVGVLYSNMKLVSLSQVNEKDSTKKPNVKKSVKKDIK